MGQCLTIYHFNYILMLFVSAFFTQSPSKSIYNVSFGPPQHILRGGQFYTSPDQSLFLPSFRLLTNSTWKVYSHSPPWLVPLSDELIPGGRYTHLAWLRTASDTFSCLGTDP